jgi:ribosomal protein S18 acetylase RimI-like enzyme
MTIADYPAALQLWTSMGGVGLRSLDDSEAGIRRFLERNPRTCFAALRGEVLRGLILSGHDGRRGYIYHAAVKPEYRRQGIGKALVAAVEEAMIREGIHKLALVVFADNPGGNAFWEGQGFSLREDLRYRNKSLNPDNI